MGFSVNKITLLGRLGRDAETRFTTNNVSVTNFSIATDHSYKDKSGEYVNEVTWHNITGFNLSDYLKKNLKKGMQLYLEGRLTKREYTDKDGIKRYNTDVMLDPKSVVFLSETRGNSEDSTDEYQSSGTDDNEDLPF